MCNTFDNQTQPLSKFTDTMSMSKAPKVWKGSFGGAGTRVQFIELCGENNNVSQSFLFQVTFSRKLDKYSK